MVCLSALLIWASEMSLIKRIVFSQVEKNCVVETNVTGLLTDIRIPTIKITSIVAVKMISI